MSQTKTSLLPSNATSEERALSLAARLGADLLPEDVKKLWQPYEVPARFLPFIAWALHADFWYDTLSEKSKRDLIAGSWNWHRHKGTPYAIRRALETLGFEYVSIDEWYRIESAPHTFQVEIAPMTEGLIRKAERCIKDYKPARSHLLELRCRFWNEEEDIAEESMSAVFAPVVSEPYPWKGAYYNSIHRYAVPADPDALLYSDVNQCEDIINVMRHSFCEYQWAPYKYDSSFTYDFSHKYSDAVQERETLATYHSVGMTDELHLSEDIKNTLFIYI